MSSGGSSRGKGRKNEPPAVGEGSLGPDFFGEALLEFPVQSRSDFNINNPLRSYDNRREAWPKCMHGEECLVHTADGGRRFYKCPRAWSSTAPQNCGFVRWIDPPPIPPYEEYIEYLQNRIFDLEREVSYNNEQLGGKMADDESTDEASSQQPLCNDPYCQCRCHKSKSPPSPPPPPPPPPPAVGGYYGEGSTQYAMWSHY